MIFLTVVLLCVVLFYWLFVSTLACEPQELLLLLLPALVGLSAPSFSAWAAARYQTAFTFSLLVSFLPSPALQLDTLGCYVSSKSAKLAFSYVQNNVSDGIVAFKEKNPQEQEETRQSMQKLPVSVQLSVHNNFHFPRSWKMSLYCLSTKALKRCFTS